MEKVTFSLPALWADHHVLAVREALGKANGIVGVLTSAMYRDVQVEYDPTAVTPDAIKSILAEAGYPINQELELSTFPERIDDESDWFQLQKRSTETDMRDLIMSGDHRKY